MNSLPGSAYDQVGGMMYFARMLDKIRLHDANELHPDYHANLGLWADSLCTGFLRVSYTDLRERVLEGATDEEVLEWCFRKGRTLDKIDLFIWNQFASKLGWNDRATEALEREKAASGLGERRDIATMFDFFDVDEGRKP